MIYGRLSPTERAAIERIATAMSKPAPGPIAQKLDRHPATVTWYMIRHGLIERVMRYGRPSYIRANGTAVHAYTREHDRSISGLRAAGLKPREIAEAVSREFGIRRAGSSIRVRLEMLAAYDEEDVQ